MALRRSRRTEPIAASPPHVVRLTELAIGIIRDAIAHVGEGKPLLCLSSEALAHTILRANESSQERPKGKFNVAECP